MGLVEESSSPLDPFSAPLGFRVVAQALFELFEMLILFYHGYAS